MTAGRPDRPRRLPPRLDPVRLRASRGSSAATTSAGTGAATSARRTSGARTAPRSGSRSRSSTSRRGSCRRSSASKVGGDWVGVLAGAAAMVGHARPVFLRFSKGGKMVATARRRRPRARAARGARLPRRVARRVRRVPLRVARLDRHRGRAAASRASPSARRGPSSGSPRSPRSACSRSIATTSAACSRAASRGSPAGCSGAPDDRRRRRRPPARGARRRGGRSRRGCRRAPRPRPGAARRRRRTARPRSPAARSTSSTPTRRTASTAAPSSRRGCPPTSTRSTPGGADRIRRASPASTASRSPAAPRRTSSSVSPTTAGDAPSRASAATASPTLVVRRDGRSPYEKLARLLRRARRRRRRCAARERARRTGDGVAIVYLGACTDVPSAAVAAHELLHALGALPAPGRRTPAPTRRGHPCDSTPTSSTRTPSGDAARARSSLDVGRDDYYGHSGSWPDVQDSLWLRLVAQQLRLALAIAGQGSVESDVPGRRLRGLVRDRLGRRAASSRSSRSPADGQRFVRWSGACTGIGPLRGDARRGALGRGALRARRGSGSSSPSSGKGKVTGAGAPCRRLPVRAHRAGRTRPLRLRATPAAGWRLAGWSGACAGRAATCTVPMTKATAVRARFVRL